MAYNLTAEQIKGTLNNASDMLSQNPISDPLQHKMLAESDVNPGTPPGSGVIRCFGVGGMGMAIESIHSCGRLCLPQI